MTLKLHNRTIIFAGLFAALTAVGAFIKIPLPHIPITLQTFFVMMSGNLLNYRAAIFSQIIYIAIGLIGIPVFAYGGGISYIFQPSFGYILSYPIAAFVIAFFLEKIDRKFVQKNASNISRYFCFLSVNMIAVFIFFIIGLAYLSFNIKYNLYLHLDQVVSAAGLNLKKAFFTAFVLFFPIELIKAILASGLSIKMRNHFLFS